MSPKPSPFILVVALPLISIFVGMIASWAWAIRQVSIGRALLPPAKPRRAPWGVGSVLLVIFAWLAANLGVALVYMQYTGDFSASLRKTGATATLPSPRSLSFTEQMVLLSVINGLLLLVTPALLRVTSRARLGDLGISWGGLPRHAWYGVVSFLLVAPVVNVLNVVVVVSWTLLGGKPTPHPLEQMVRGEFSPGVVALAILSAVILAPAAEELIFRGIIQGWLARALSPRDPGDRFQVEPADLADISVVSVVVEEGPFAAPEPRRWWLPQLPRPVRDALVRSSASRELPILLTSLLFAILHLAQWPAPIAIFLLSLGLGLVYERTGSLISSFMMHAMFNGLATLVLFFSMLVAAPPKEAAPPSSRPPSPANHVVVTPHPEVSGKHR